MTAHTHDEPSPRTAEAPMAFTPSELVTGAVAAGAIFITSAPILLSLVSLIIDAAHAGLTIYIIIVGTLIVGVPATLITVIALTPVARLIGRALEREARRWPHLLAFGALGAAASLLASAGVALVFGAFSGGTALGSSLAFMLPVGGVLAPVAAVSAALGWLSSARRALRADRRDSDATVIAR